MPALDQIQRLLTPLSRRIRLVVSRAVVRASDDSQALQTLDLDLLAGEQRNEVQRVQEYGFTSRPPAGAEAVVVAVGGDRAQGVVVATDDRAHRPKDLAEGESALWTADHGLRVHCRDDGHVDLGSAPSDFVALARLVMDELESIKADLDEIKKTFDAHTHSYDAYPSTPTLTSVPSDSPAGTPPAPIPLSWSPSDVAAAEVRAK